MPKRIGYVWEELTSIEHCEETILRAIRNKRKTKYLIYISKHYKKYAEKLQQVLLNGWKPKEPRLKTINEGTRQKRRDLMIPSLFDHFIHTAVALIFEKYLTNKFYFYSCGSMPKRGQTWATKAIEKHVKRKQPKYCALADVRKFYQSVRKKHVVRCLKRFFKDKKFLALNELILDQMDDQLAIGFAVSHWYGQLVLSFIDRELKTSTKRSKMFMVRFMDNFAFFCGRKRTLHRKIDELKNLLRGFDLKVKDDWQVFPIKTRMVEFLSYRFGYEKTLLRKGLMYRMSKCFRNAHRNLDAHKARRIMSYRGILKHCDSYNFRKAHMYKNVSIKLCRRLISDADKKRFLCGKTKEVFNSALWQQSYSGVSA